MDTSPFPPSPATLARTAAPNQTERFKLGPQPGPQTQAALSTADILVYGGAAGSGKTRALLMEPLRYCTKLPGFDAIIFRRTTPQIVNPGGLWSESKAIYQLSPETVTHLGDHSYTWPGGGSVRLAHLQYEDTVHDWQGAQVAFLGFDELTQFTSYQFWYLVSRNRSTCGVRPYVRATCNPDSWVADFIAWWIDQDTGFPIPGRIGVIRYVVRGIADKLIWADNPDELRPYLPKAEQLPPGVPLPEPKSVTFIPGSIYDNPALLRVNPDYLANLQALPLVERERLLGGNWKIRPAAGLYFRREWCAMINPDEIPAGLFMCRYWDLAGTEKTETNDPDWTCGVKLGRDVDGFLYVLDVVMIREGPYEVEQTLRNVASHDTHRVPLGFGLDPGQAGKFQASYLVRNLIGYTVLPEPESGDKATRFGPFSSQCRAGNVRIVRGPWNEQYFRMLEGFPEVAHDDAVDASSGALELLTEHISRPLVISDETLRRSRQSAQRSYRL